MIRTQDKIQIITCDKCGVGDSAEDDIAPGVFKRNGWKVKTTTTWTKSGKRVKECHLCKDCAEKDRLCTK